jgi:hypothetical protein
MLGGSQRSETAYMAAAMLIACLAVGCASSSGRVLPPGDAQVVALTALVRQAQEANGRGDFNAAKTALTKARADLASASNAVVTHPRYMKLINELTIAESGIAEAEWMAVAQPRLKGVTSEAKHAAEQAMHSRQTFENPEVWGQVAQRFAACRAAIFDLRQMPGYTAGAYVDSAFGSLPLANIDAQCAKSEKQATLARDQAEHRTSVAKKGKGKHKKSGRG